MVIASGFSILLILPWNFFVCKYVMRVFSVHIMHVYMVVQFIVHLFYLLAFMASSTSSNHSPEQCSTIQLPQAFLPLPNHGVLYLLTSKAQVFLAKSSNPHLPKLLQAKVLNGQRVKPNLPHPNHPNSSPLGLNFGDSTLNCLLNTNLSYHNSP